MSSPSSDREISSQASWIRCNFEKSQRPIATLVPGLRDRRLIRHSSNSLADQAKVPRAGIRSKISGNQIIRTPASANVDLGSGGTYQISVGIERAQKTRLIRAGIWLN
jgi:hypothetical protein